MFQASPLPPLLHIHGAAFSCWVLLLIVQTSLVATGRVDLHRRLGLLGFGLACLMVILGLLVATNAMVRFFDAAEAAHKQAELRAGYAFPTCDMLIFSTLIYFAFRNRSNPAAHKRLVIIATIALLDAAFGRWPIDVVSTHFQFGCFALLLTLVGHDLWFTRAVGRCVVFPAVSGTGYNRANRSLAVFRCIGAESGRFFALFRLPLFPLGPKQTGAPWYLE